MKDLSYFMSREVEERVVEIPAPPRFCDKNGQPLMLEVRVLGAKRMQEIRERCTRRRVAVDEKTNRPLVQNGEVVHEVLRDSERIVNHTLVEALQYPDLTDAGLMESHGCVDVCEMPMLVFARNDEYEYVVDAVFGALGVTEDAQADKALLDAAKN